MADIFIFGSVLKGKEQPSDIDVVSLFRIKDYKLFEEVDYKIKQEGDKLSLNMHVEPLLVDDIHSNEAYRNIIHEGFSIKHMQMVRKVMGLYSSLLITYNLKNKNPSEKVMFSYALFGREKGKGILFEMGGKELGKGSVLVPVEKESEILLFFKQWEVEFKKRRILLYS